MTCRLLELTSSPHRLYLITILSLSETRKYPRPYLHQRLSVEWLWLVGNTPTTPQDTGTHYLWQMQTLIFLEAEGHSTGRTRTICNDFGFIELLPSSWVLRTMPSYRSVRNFVIDLRRYCRFIILAYDAWSQASVFVFFCRVAPDNPQGTGLHWQVAQATSLMNIVVQMSTASNTAHQGSPSFFFGFMMNVLVILSS